MESALHDEAEFIRRAQAGDAASFGALVERHQEVAFRAAYLIVRDAAAAEDVAEESFVRAFRQLGSFREGMPFRPWLLRIVQNLALNEVRSRTRRAGLVSRIGIFSRRAQEGPHAEVAAADEATLVLRAISQLPPDDRVILHLRYYLELPEREIAAAIGKPAGTVKSRLHRAAARLRDVIKREYPGLRERDDG